MQTIRILADDLTGALDTAGCFAGPGSRLPVVLDAALLPPAESCAISIESRDIAEIDAVARLKQLGPIFDHQDGIAFKKIDSLLRGHVAAEIAYHVRQGGFDAVLIAPAFPALGRVTRNGRQWAKLAGHEEYQMVGPDLARELVRFGIDLKHGLPEKPATGSPQVYLADAESDDDLKTIVAAGMQGGRVLWCGSAGLAEILAGGGIDPVSLTAGRVLVICGTRHPVALLQVEHLCRSAPSACATLRQDADVAVASRIINDRLRAGTWAALAADFPEMSAGAARAALQEIFKAILPTLDRPDALLVMGGDTLAICCEALGARKLAVRGLLSRGIPVSDFADGDWAEMTVISKSGAFGAENTLSRIMEMTGATRDAGDSPTSAQSRLRQKVPNH